MNFFSSFSSCRGVHKVLLAFLICSIIGLLLLVSLGGDKSWTASLIGFGSREVCRSRDESASFWKPSSSNPSPYLLRRLRKYEELHRRCGPNTKSYREAEEQLIIIKGSSNHSHQDLAECKYVVWIPDSGLGNRMISIASAFLYALLNDKVLLLASHDNFKGLFCEPFPGTSWLLPSDFPLKNLYGLYKGQTPQSLATLLQDKKLSLDNHTANPTIPFVYVHIMHDSGDLDKMFFCDGAQNLLRKLQWVMIRANNYYAPGFFLASQYSKELNRLFPVKDTVFHHLARYLLLPRDPIWQRITQYYNANLSMAKIKVGLQVRELPFQKASFKERLDQYINCSTKAGLLPDHFSDLNRSVALPGEEKYLKSVLVVSLKSQYYDKIKEMYDEYAKVTREPIAVYQPSHEGWQHTENLNHNVKALTDIYLLSFSDYLVTTEQSTFGYVAYSLGGTRPWIVQMPDENRPPSSCRRSESMDPCFMDPPRFDCQKQPLDDDLGTKQPYLRRCEDRKNGIKLFNV